MDNLRRIVLVFSIALFFTLAIAGIVLAFSNINKPSSENIIIEPSATPFDGDPTSGNATPKPFEDTKVRCLFIMEGNSSCENVYFISSVDKVTGEYSLCFMPSDSKISIKNSSNNFDVFTLNQFYKTSPSKLLEAISGKLGVNIKDYVAFDLEGFGAFINYFTSRDNGVEFNIPVYLSFNYEGKNVSFSAGKQYLGGLQAERFLSFMKTDDGIYSNELSKYYDGTERARLKIVSSFVAEFVYQKMTNDINDFYKENYLSFLNQFVETYSKTNISKTDISNYKEAMSLVTKDKISVYLYDINNQEFSKVKIAINRVELESLGDSGLSSYLLALN